MIKKYRKYRVNLHKSIYETNEPKRSSAQMEFGVEFVRIRVGDRVGKNVHSRPLVVQLNKFTRKKSLKGHGNDADFLGFLQKLVPHRSLTLPFEPFRFWLRIRGDIRNRKRLPDSSRRVGF
jgi:hypothetical protein